MRNKDNLEKFGSKLESIKNHRNMKTKPIKIVEF